MHMNPVISFVYKAAFQNTKKTYDRAKEERTCLLFFWGGSVLVRCICNIDVLFDHTNMTIVDTGWLFLNMLPFMLHLNYHPVQKRKRLKHDDCMWSVSDFRGCRKTGLARLREL